MQALDWICMVWFKAIQFRAVWFGASQMNSDDLTYLSMQFKGKKPLLAFE
jgi:hypothetical protein